MGHEGKTRHAESKEHNQQPAKRAIEQLRGSIEMFAFYPPVQTHHRGNTEHQIQDRPEGVGVKGEWNISMDESGEARGQTTTGTGSPKKHYARAGR